MGCKSILIGSFYRPPNLTDPAYLLKLQSSLSRIRSRHGRGSTICLGGDFNLGDIQWQSNSVETGSAKVALCEQMLEIAHRFNLHQVVTEPTRNGRILDLFFTTNPSLVDKVINIPGMSDHDGIPMIDLITKPKLNKRKPRKIYNFNKANVEGLKNDLGKLHQQTTSTNSSSVEDDWCTFRDKISQAMDTHVPSKMSSKRNDSPWISKSIKCKLRAKQRAYNKARSSGRASDLERFHKIRKEVQKLTKQSYWKWVRSSCVESTKQFWGFIRKLKKDCTGIPALRENGKLVTDSVGKAEILNRQFDSVFTNEDSKIPDVTDSKSYPSMPDIIVTQEGLLKLLQKIDANKASGPDGIPAKILKLCAEELAPSLASIFNKSFSSGNLPTDWLSANITPIFKKGDHASASNYRPVSLTPICCKLFEHILHSNIMNHLDKHNILTNRQHGFRKKHSCESQLILTIHDLVSSLDTRTPVDMIIMDFSKAFDTVPHKRLLLKLHHYGITGNIHTWITKFLTTRRQRVVVDGDHSKWVHVRSGVPQGTVLGPLLFNLYLNDLPENITSEVRLFADDCVMYRPIQSNIDADKLQSDLDTLSTWQNKWQMKFNADKCFVLKASHARSPSQHQYKLGNSTLAETKSHSYLGVTISNDLKWVEQTNSAVSKANKVLGLIRRNLYSCPSELKSTAYKSLVRPHLEYASTVWDPFTSNQIDKLEAVQRRAARFAIRDYDYTSSVTKMLQELDWHPLQMRRSVARLTMMQKIVTGQVAIPAQKFLQPVSRPSRHHNSKSFKRPSVNKDCLGKSFFPRTIAEWNLLPESTINIENTATFKKQVTKQKQLHSKTHPSN